MSRNVSTVGLLEPGIYSAHTAENTGLFDVSGIEGSRPMADGTRIISELTHYELFVDTARRLGGVVTITALADPDEKAKYRVSLDDVDDYRLAIEQKMVQKTGKTKGIRLPEDLNEPRQWWIYDEMLAFAEDGSGLFDDSGERGTIVWHDNNPRDDLSSTVLGSGFAGGEKRKRTTLTNLEWLQIVAHNLGGAVVIERNGRLSEGARTHNKLAQEKNKGSHVRKMEYYYSVLVAGITPEEFSEGLLRFDPLDNRIQC